MTSAEINNTPAVPSLPDAEPIVDAVVAGQVRHVLTALAGAGFIASAYDTDSNAAMIAGMLVSVGIQAGTMLWSWLQKRSAERRVHAAAVMSAKAATPLKPAA